MCNRQFGAYRSRNIDGRKVRFRKPIINSLPSTGLILLRWDITRSLNIDFTATNKTWVDEDSGRLDKAEKKANVEEFLERREDIAYQQTANFTYTVPTNKDSLAGLDNRPAGIWIFLPVDGGVNTCHATSAISFKIHRKKKQPADFNFTRFYAKWRLLRELDQQTTPPPRQTCRAKSNDSLNQEKTTLIH